MNSPLPTFWKWFYQGAGGRPGFRRLINGWLLFHVGIAVVLTELISAPVAVVAEKTLLPVMAIFVGLTFSWAGNAHALLQSDEIIDLAKNRKGGIAEYVFTFQLSILVLLVAIGLWVLPSLQLPYVLESVGGRREAELLGEIILYAVLSISLRTSWQAVLGANMLLLVRAELRRDQSHSSLPPKQSAGRTMPDDRQGDAEEAAHR